MIDTQKRLRIELDIMEAKIDNLETHVIILEKQVDELLKYFDSEMELPQYLGESHGSN